MIRAAAFEGMCPGNSPSEELFNFHKALATGGVAMTTVAYAAVRPFRPFISTPAFAEKRSRTGT